MRKSYFTLLVIVVALSVCRFDAVAVARRTYITVTAGSADRRDTVVSFALPKSHTAKYYALRDRAGKLIPVQVDSAGAATFVIGDLKAGSSKKYSLEALKAPVATDLARTTTAGDKLAISAAGRRVLEYQTGQGHLPKPEIRRIFQRGGYIHPVYAPSGRIVTDDYPPDHYHHHGIWFAWTKTEFEGHHPDFWNVGDGTARVDFAALDGTWSGPVHAGFKARNRYVDIGGPKPVTVLDEEWTVTVYNVGRRAKPYSMFDLVSSQECATSSPLILPEYRYGGVGLRGSREWLSKDNCVFLTSEGKGRIDGHGTRARWCHLGGRVDGELEGIAILDHPGNFRSPQPMRLNPDQPFFCYAPSQMGQWEISPGKRFISRYRFIVYDGPPDPAELDRLWNDYAHPPQVTITVE